MEFYDLHVLQTIHTSFGLWKYLVAVFNEDCVFCTDTFLDAEVAARFSGKLRENMVEEFFKIAEY